MKIFMRFIAISLSLIGLISLLILLPAYLSNTISNWQIIFLAISYFIFFMATVWRTTKYGNLAKHSEDQQIKKLSGRFASIVAIIGFGGFHWLAIYDYSRCQTSLSSKTNILFSVIGISLISSAIVINHIAVKTLGKFFDRLIIKNQHQLVTTGIYSKIRHPIYTSYIMLFIGFSMVLQSLLSCLVLSIVSLIWFGNRIRLEEEMLEQEFGKNYQIYQQQTKRLIPFVF